MASAHERSVAEERRILGGVGIRAVVEMRRKRVYDVHLLGRLLFWS